VRKILQDDGLMISASVVQSPVFYGHAQMVNFEAMRPLAAEEARDAFTAAKISSCPKSANSRLRSAMLPVRASLRRLRAQRLRYAGADSVLVRCR
jgi:aspartate-semialdehyde dehydrogenase